MRSTTICRLLCGFFGVAAVAGRAAPAQAIECALYARAETGIGLYGDAGSWWDQAAGRYQRGHEPAPGAILVFKPSRYIRHGHVAIVSKIVGRREILVDQANWYAGRINRGMSVIDSSPANDWTSVKVEYLASGTHGRDNPTFGFVYPGPAPTSVASAEDSGRDRSPTGRDVAEARDRHSRTHDKIAEAHDRRRPPTGHQVAEAHDRRHPPTGHQVAEAHDRRHPPTGHQIAEAHDRRHPPTGHQVAEAHDRRHPPTGHQVAEAHGGGHSPNHRELADADDSRHSPARRAGSKELRSAGSRVHLAAATTVRTERTPPATPALANRRAHGPEPTSATPALLTTPSPRPATTLVF